MMLTTPIAINRKKPAVGSWPRSFLIFRDLHFTSALVDWATIQKAYCIWLRVSPGRWGWTQVEIPQQTSVFRIDCYWCFWHHWHTILNDPIPIYTVIQHWLLATDSNCIAVDFLLTLQPCSKNRVYLGYGRIGRERARSKDSKIRAILLIAQPNTKRMLRLS